MNHSTSSNNKKQNKQQCWENLSEAELAAQERKDFLWFIIVYAIILLVLVLFGNYLQPEVATVYYK